MKLSKLLPLILILAVLVGIALVKQKKQRPVSIEQAVKLSALVPDDLTAADLAKIELYRGSKTDEKVTLIRDVENADKWHVASQFNAPVSKQKIESYIKALAKLKGEPRATATSDDDLKRYNLTNDLAFHVTGFKKDATTPVFHILVGKSPQSNATLARMADAKEVSVIDADLRRDAGVFDDAPMGKMPGADVPPPQPPKPLTADSWLDKQILDLNKDKIKRIAVTTPDKKLVFERREKPAAEQKPDAPAAGGEKAAEPPKPAGTPQYEWALAEGGPGGTFKQTGLDGVLRAFNPLTASDIVDPAKKAEYGLDNPAFKCVLAIDGQEGDVVIEGGRPNASSDGYVRVSSASQDLVYKLAGYSFERIYPKGTELFDLPVVTVDKKAMDHIELNQPEGKVVLAKSGEDWTVTEPAVDLPVEKNTVDSLANALAGWRAADYTDAKDGLGLDSPTRKVIFSAGPGASHTIVLGADAKSVAGAYARLDDGPNAVVMSKSDMDRVFVPLKNLFQRALMEGSEDDITSIAVERAEDPFTLTRNDKVWTLAAGKANSEADPGAADALAAALAGLQASDIRFNQKALVGPARVTIRIKAKEGKEHVLQFGADESGAMPLSVSGKKAVFSIETAKANEVLPASATLVKKAEPKPEPKPEEGAKPEAAKTLEAAPAPVVKLDSSGAPTLDLKADKEAKPAAGRLELKMKPEEKPAKKPAPEPSK